MIQFCIETASFQKCFMTSLFNDISIFHYKDDIRFTDCGKSVSNNKAGSSFHHSCKRLLNLNFCTGIDAGSCFI